jgi:uncharacterized protein YqeY
MREKLEKDLKAAMISKDQDRLLVLRSLKSDLQYRKVELTRELSPEEILAVFKKAVKSREQAIELYVQGNRPELAEKEQREIAIIQEYLPAELASTDIESFVAQAIAEVNPSSPKEMGAVMKKAMELLGGRADGKTVSAIVKRMMSA